MRKRIPGAASGEVAPGWDANPVGTLELMGQARRALGLQRPLQGHADPNFTLSITADDYTRDEFIVLRRGTLAEWFTGQAAVALQQAVWELTPAVGTIAVVREVHLTNLTAGAVSYRWGFTTANGGTIAANAQQRDQRMRGKLGTVIPRYNTIAGPFTPSGQRFSVPANTSVIIPVTYVMTGADATVFAVVCEGINTQGEVGLVWTERPAGPQE